jgi:hypothetical protein
MGRRRLLIVGMAAAAALVACTGPGSPAGPGPSGGPERLPDRPAFESSAPADPVTVVPAGTAAELALAVSGALFDRAPVVVLAPETDAAAQRRAEAAATELGAPVLVPAPGLPAELERLDTKAVLAVGVPPAEASSAVHGSGVHVVPESADGPGRLPDAAAAHPLDDVLLLTSGDPTQAVAAATGRVAGAHVSELPDGDPRTDPDLIAWLAKRPAARVLALGAAFGDGARLGERVKVAATGVQLPGGGQVLFPNRRLVALYGHPGSAALGALGEQPVEQAVQRAKKVAAEYAPLSDVPVVPAFEIIATVASSSAGKDGDYSNEAAVDALEPWVQAAGEAGVYVFLDLQPGTTDFLTQAKRYESLLAQPHVGLALDPEWRLKPGQRHLRQIGTVDVDEVNDVITWLADLTREQALPQKLLVLHQFRLSMISGREHLDTSRDELAVVIHADGNGTPGQKMATWNALRVNPPDGVWWAWKNFYDEDRPTFTPAETMRLDPQPVLVSYQ